MERCNNDYPNYPMDDFKKILVSEEEIKGIICRIANEINEDYKGRKLLVCGILKGAFIFTSDLIRRINIPLEVTFIKASSYGKSSVSAGEVKVIEFSDLEDYKGFDIIVVDDILDSGNTLNYLKGYLKTKASRTWISALFWISPKEERKRSMLNI